MLTFISTSFILCLFSFVSSYSFIVICFFIMVYFVSNLNIFTSCCISGFFLDDEVSLFINFLLFFIMFISFIGGMHFRSLIQLNFVLVSLLVFCYFVFAVNNLFLLYFFYEASLIPILYIVINWGSYPERSISAIILLIYTALFGAPLLVLLIYSYLNFNTFNFILLYNLDSFSNLFSLIVFLCFAVKLPIYGLHYWLPIAHVEAPTFGSVILASILLKLGGVGLIRLSLFINIDSLSSFILSYFIVFTVFTTVVCCFQSDLNRLIAYSSVAHIIVIPFLLFSNNIISFQSLLIVIIFHGLSSTLLFIIVGTLYSMFSTRQLVLMRGLVLISPLFTFFIILTFFYTLSAPPFPSFIAEVFFIMSSFFLSNSIILVFIPFAFIGLVYNLNWLTSVNFGSSNNMVYVESNLNYSVFIIFSLVFVNTILLIFLFSYFWTYSLVLYTNRPLW